MVLATGETGHRAPSTSTAKFPLRLLVVMQENPHDPDEHVVCGISRRDYLYAQWRSGYAELIESDQLHGREGGHGSLPVALMNRRDICFNADESLLHPLQHGECKVLVVRGVKPARYREELVINNDNEVAAVRRTYVSGQEKPGVVSEYTSSEDLHPIGEIIAVIADRNIADQVAEAIDNLENACECLQQSGIEYKEAHVQERIVHASNVTQLKWRLLRLLERRPEVFTIAANRAGLQPRNFGWADPSAQIHPTARFVGKVIIGANVSIGPRAVIIGPLILEDGTEVAADEILRAADQKDCDPFTFDPDEIAPELDDSRPRQHVRDSSWWFRSGYPFLKRTIDLTGAVIMFVMLGVLVPIVWIANRLNGDRGPLFYTHLRQSRGGKVFPCLKFRSMVVNADEIKEQLKKQNDLDGPQFKMDNDPRITPVGRFLRKTNLDELPQAVNIVQGYMSLVGPRPSPHDENQLCPAWRHARLSVRPGITGLWQVYRSKVRGADDFQEWIYYDMDYVRRRSFRLDLKILFLTVLVCTGVWTPPEARASGTEEEHKNNG